MYDRVIYILLLIQNWESSKNKFIKEPILIKSMDGKLTN